MSYPNPEHQFSPGTQQPQNPSNPRDILPPELQTELRKIEDSAFNLPPADLDSLNEKHKLAAELESLGYSTDDIVHQLGVTPFWLHRLRQSPTYQVYKEELRKAKDYESQLEPEAELKKATGEALDTLLGIMRNSDDERLRYNCAAQILDRQIPKINRQEITAEHKVAIGSPIMWELATSMAQMGHVDPARLKEASPDELIEMVKEACEKEITAPKERREISV